MRLTAPLLLVTAVRAAGMVILDHNIQPHSVDGNENRMMEEEDGLSSKSIQNTHTRRQNLHTKPNPSGPTGNQPYHASSNDTTRISTSTTSSPAFITPSTTIRPSSSFTNPPTNSTSNQALPTATGIAAPGNNSNMTSVSCADLCSKLSFSIDYPVAPVSCQSYSAGSSIAITGGQSTANCGSSFTTSVGLCRVVLTVSRSQNSETYMEVWMPSDSTTSWNGRSMNTDNGGLNGCVAFDDMQYVTGMGFAAIGDNGGHNSSAFDGTWMTNKAQIADWAGRARHASAQAGKSVINQFYGRPANYSYYIGCSTGGAQGMHAAQYYPNDFNGIIAGSSAADYNHLQDWSSRFIQLTGTGTSDARFLTLDDWVFVQSHILDQCDGKIDGVADGILEDPTLCQLDYTTLSCANNQTSGCLTDTQTNTVREVFTPLYNTQGQLLFPSLLYGSQVDAYRLGQLSGTVQGIANDWWRYGVHNDSNFDSTTVGQSDYALADSLDSSYGNPSSFSGDISSFRNAGNKLLIYHGNADPLVSGANSQRYYLKVAKTLGASNTDLDPFLRLFRISGMAHCGLGGISGAGAWMFGQNAPANVEGVVDNVIDNMVSWVEKGDAPDVLTGTKFFNDQPSSGLQYVRPHCRFPYRTTYNGGDSTRASGWGCTLIENWGDCGVGAEPRLCNADGSFTP